MRELTAFERDCLVVIGGLGDPIGLEINTELEDYYLGEINSAQLYPGLDRLAERGLITKRERDGRSNYYALTDAGTDLLHARRTWENQQLE